MSGSNTYTGATTVDGGTLQLAAGRLSSPTQYVGYNFSGAFVQSGGTNTASSTLYLGYNTRSSGSYALSGGSLSAAQRVSRLLRQRHFSRSRAEPMRSTVWIGYSSSASGTYNLSGGSLVLGGGGLTKGTGSATFNFGGGTLDATGWSSPLNMNLYAASAPGPSIRRAETSPLGQPQRHGRIDQVRPQHLMLSGSNTTQNPVMVFPFRLSDSGCRC